MFGTFSPSFFLRPHKKSLVYHLRPHPTSRPHRYFFICLIPHENKVYGFVSVVVMNCKFKKTRFSGFLGAGSKHMFQSVLKVLTDSGPSCIWQLVVVY